STLNRLVFKNNNLYEKSLTKKPLLTYLSFSKKSGICSIRFFFLIMIIAVGFVHGVVENQGSFC
ncbi:hypothetical protein, partial [Peribacillus sp. NPDC058002]|uniref:hypothetical protein n=1 Tax=Peribacillus sp. NPDC058002 TaxID=3346301 RepID=UPI0036D96E13